MHASYSSSCHHHQLLSLAPIKSRLETFCSAAYAGQWSLNECRNFECSWTDIEGYRDCQCSIIVQYNAFIPLLHQFQLLCSRPYGRGHLWCASDVSVAYIGPKSRTERPRKTKIGTGSRHTWLGHYFQGQRCRWRGHIVAASRTACFGWLAFIMRPSIGGGRILRRTSVCPSVRPSRYRCHR